MNNIFSSTAVRTCLAIVSATVATGCRTEVPAVVASVDPRGWDKPVTLIVDNRDTVSERSVSIVLRHGAECDSLPLRIEVSLPDAGHYGERFVVYPSRRRPSSVPVTERFPYRDRSVLSESGYYLFTISPLVPVSEVEAVGVEILKEQ